MVNRAASRAQFLFKGAGSDNFLPYHYPHAQSHRYPHSGRWGISRRGGRRALTPGPEESAPIRGGRGTRPSFLAGRPVKKGRPRPGPPAHRVRAPGGDRRYCVRRCTPDYHRCAVGPIPSPLRGDRIFPTVPSRLGFTSFNQAQRRHARRPVTCSSPLQGGTFPPAGLTRW